MIEFGQIDCFFDRANTGFGPCVPKMGKLEYTIAVPVGTSITRSQAQDLVSYLNTLFIEDVPQERGYLLPKWISVTDNTGDSVTEDLGGGVTQKLYDAAVVWVRRTIVGGLCAHLCLRQHDKSAEKWEYLECFRSLDKSAARFFITGRKYYNSTSGENELRGFKYADIDVPTRKIASATAGDMITMKTTMEDTDQWNDDILFMPFGYDLRDLNTVKNVDVSMTKASAGNFDVLATYGCGGRNLIEAHPGVFDDSDAWEVINQLDNVVATTGVTEVSGKYRLALDTADANYTAGTHFRARLQPISVTSAAPFDVDYIESNTTLAVAK